jgi:hypothetical protein
MLQGVYGYPLPRAPVQNLFVVGATGAATKRLLRKFKQKTSVLPVECSSVVVVVDAMIRQTLNGY